MLLGSSGEDVHLCNVERVCILRHVKQELEKAGFPDYPIIAITATQSIEETVQQLKEAQNAGSQWGLVLAPGYFAPAVSQDGLVEWYKAVADRSTVPILM